MRLQDYKSYRGRDHFLFSPPQASCTRLQELVIDLALGAYKAFSKQHTQWLNSILMDLKPSRQLEGAYLGQQVLFEQFCEDLLKIIEETSVIDEPDVFEAFTAHVHSFHREYVSNSRALTPQKFLVQEHFCTVINELGDRHPTGRNLATPEKIELAHARDAVFKEYTSITLDAYLAFVQELLSENSSAVRKSTSDAFTVLQDALHVERIFLIAAKETIK